jgi:hypothetical protein
MSTDSDSAEALLAAAQQSDDRAIRLVYTAEARMCLARERERLRQQQLLLDAIEAELVRTANADGGP